MDKTKVEECKVEEGEKWSFNDVLKWPAIKELASVQPAIVEKPVESFQRFLER